MYYFRITLSNPLLMSVLGPPNLTQNSYNNEKLSYIALDGFLVDNFAIY